MLADPLAKDKPSPYYSYVHGDWDPEDWKDVHKGDEVFVILYEDNSTGILMHGQLYSDARLYGPFPGTRSGVSGTNIITDIVINSDKNRLLSPNVLSSVMPDFQWFDLHSGRALPDKYVPILHQMWKEYLEMNNDFKDDKPANFRWKPNTEKRV